MKNKEIVKIKNSERNSGRNSEDGETLKTNEEYGKNKEVLKVKSIVKIKKYKDKDLGKYKQNKNTQVLGSAARSIRMFSCLPGADE